jgi:hypothetical protein
MEQLFFTVAILVFVLGIRGVSIATEISEAIGYEGSGIELYYKIQSQVFNPAPEVLGLIEDSHIQLYKMCILNTRIMLASILITTILIMVLG